MALRIFYTIFIGVLLAAFVGVGIAAFYPAPASPDYNSVVTMPAGPTPQSTGTAEMVKEQTKFNQMQRDYQATMNVYNRNVSIISIVAAVIFLAISLTLLRQVDIMADGLLLGGILTLLYGIGRGFGTSDNLFRFVAVTVGLVVALGLGYVKVVKSGSAR